MKQSHFVFVISLLVIAVCIGENSAQQDPSTENYEKIDAILKDDEPHIYCQGSLVAVMKQICAVKDKMKSQIHKVNSQIGELIFQLGVMLQFLVV